MNAANEEAVDAFLKEQIPFTAIPDVIKRTVDFFAGKNPSGEIALETILNSDRQARSIIKDFISGKRRS